MLALDPPRNPFAPYHPVKPGVLGWSGRLALESSVLKGQQHGDLEIPPSQMSPAFISATIGGHPLPPSRGNPSYCRLPPFWPPPARNKFLFAPASCPSPAPIPGPTPPFPSHGS